MARTDNLNNFLTDVAQSIRDKKGTTENIKASDFDTEIASIETGGGADFEITDASYLFYKGARFANESDFLKLIKQPITCTSMYNGVSFDNNSVIDLSNVDLSKCTDFSYGFSSGSNGNSPKDIKFHENKDWSSCTNFNSAFRYYNLENPIFDLSEFKCNQTTATSWGLAFGNSKFSKIIMPKIKISNISSIITSSSNLKIFDMSLVEIAQMGSSSSFNNFLSACPNLEEILGVIDLNSLPNSVSVTLSGAPLLRTLFIKNIGSNLNVSALTELSSESIDFLLNNVRSSASVGGRTLTLGDVNKAKASAEAIAHAESLYWTIV